MAVLQGNHFEYPTGLTSPAGDALRTRRICLVLLAIWILNGFDLILTILAHDQGFIGELNPIATALLAQSPLALSVFKCAMVGFGTGVLLHQRRRALAEYVAAAMLILYVVVSLQWSLCYRYYETAFYYYSNNYGIPSC